jgi:hypothetical protein
VDKCEAANIRVVSENDVVVAEKFLVSCFGCECAFGGGISLIVSLVDYEAAGGKNAECNERDSSSEEHRYRVYGERFEEEGTYFVTAGVEPLPSVLHFNDGPTRTGIQNNEIDTLLAGQRVARA